MTSSPITFAVDDVVPSMSPLATCKSVEAVQSLLNTLQGDLSRTESHGELTCRCIEACWDYALDCVANIGYHPIIAATHLAFSEHRPLVLSPDMIWVTIVQGLAQHIRLEPEKYRDLLVQHTGKRDLIIERADLHRGDPNSPWDAAISQLAGKLCQKTGKLATALLCNFSTTGLVERTVSEVALFDVFQPYYNYKVVCICGIPSITLEGTPADWQKLRDKVELLAPFGLDWWLRELRPICDQFARAAAGDIDQHHWQRIYTIRAVYGGKVINGWLGKLFPYTISSHRNALLDPKIEEEICRLESEGNLSGTRKASPPGIGAATLPRGLSQVPFTFADVTTGTETAMEFIAGLIAVTQNKETGALRPALGWAVCESALIEQAMLRLAAHRIKPTHIDALRQKLESLYEGYFSAEMFRFYREVEEALIFGANHVPLCYILPIEKQKTRLTEKWGVTNSRNLLFAELSDGTEIVSRYYSWEKDELNAVFVWNGNDGTVLPDTGQKIARSFAEFLFRILDNGSEPYFRRADFVPLV